MATRRQLRASGDTRARRDGPSPEAALSAGIGWWARAAPETTAIARLGGTVSYGELDSRQRALAGFMAAQGVTRDDRIAVLSSNRAELLEVTTGALRAGVVPVPIHPALTWPEISYILEDSTPRVLFSDRPIETPPSVGAVVSFGNAYERCLHEAEIAPLADYTRGRPMHYTSGTTGWPKGVWVRPSHDKRSAESSTRFRVEWGLTSDDGFLLCSSLTHSAPHRFATRTLEAGGMVVVQERFDAAETLAAVELFGATATFMVPTHLERVFQLNRKQLIRHDLSSIRLLAHAGAPIRDATKRRTMDLFPEGSVWEFYGATEGQATRISSAEWLRKPGSVGTARPGARIRILDDAGAELTPGSIGQVWIEDPDADRFEYWGDPEKTADAWLGDAFTVGDLGELDEDGYLYLRGRKHHTIVTGGVNVYPQEVERVLLEHPSVAEAMVFGVPHPEWGQQVTALVVPAWGRPLDPDRLREWARERLAGFKCPRHIEIADELPRTPTGKPRRPEL